METLYNPSKASNVSLTVRRIGSLLRMHRDQRQISQSKLAKEIGIAQSYLSQIELHGIMAVPEHAADMFMDWLFG